MLLLEVLVLTCAVVRVFGDCHVAETLKCTKLFRPFPILKGMAETEEDMDFECTVQDLFYECLMKVRPFCYPGSKGALPEEMVPAFNTVRMLCTAGTALRERYLMYSLCMNDQDTDFCEAKRKQKFEMYGITVEDIHETSYTRFCIKAHLSKTCSKEVGEFYWELVYSFYPVIDPLTGEPVLIAHRSVAHSIEYLKRYANPMAIASRDEDNAEDLENQSCDSEDSDTCAADEIKTVPAESVPYESGQDTEVVVTVGDSNTEYGTAKKQTFVELNSWDETSDFEPRPIDKLQINTRIIVDGRNEKKSKIAIKYQ